MHIKTSIYLFFYYNLILNFCHLVATLKFILLKSSPQKPVPKIKKKNLGPRLKFHRYDSSFIQKNDLPSVNTIPNKSRHVTEQN